MTILIASNYIDNLLPVRDTYDKDYPPTLKVYNTSLDKASLSS